MNNSKLTSASLFTTQYVNATVDSKISAAAVFTLPIAVVNAIDIIKFQEMVNSTGVKESKILSKLFPELFGLCASIATNRIFMKDDNFAQYIIQEGGYDIENLSNLEQAANIWFRLDTEEGKTEPELTVYIQLSHADIVALYKASKHIAGTIQFSIEQGADLEYLPINYVSILFQDALLNYFLPNE